MEQDSRQCCTCKHFSGKRHWSTEGYCHWQMPAGTIIPQSHWKREQMMGDDGAQCECWERAESEE